MKEWRISEFLVRKGWGCDKVLVLKELYNNSLEMMIGDYLIH